MQISYEKCRSGPSGAPAAVPPKLCRGESLPLSGMGGRGHVHVCASARTRSGNGCSPFHSVSGATLNSSAQEKEK